MPENTSILPAGGIEVIVEEKLEKHFGASAYRYGVWYGRHVWTRRVLRRVKNVKYLFNEY